jgi:hypothetical protein
MLSAPPEVTQHHLNLTGQNVLTYVSWALTIALVGVAVELGRRERTSFYSPLRSSARTSAPARR